MPDAITGRWEGPTREKSPPRSSTTTVDPPRPRIPADVGPRSTPSLTSQARRARTRRVGPEGRRRCLEDALPGRMTRRTTPRPKTGARPSATRKASPSSAGGRDDGGAGDEAPGARPRRRERGGREPDGSVPAAPPPARPSRTSSARTVRRFGSLEPKVFCALSDARRDGTAPRADRAKEAKVPARRRHRRRAPWHPGRRGTRQRTPRVVAPLLRRLDRARGAEATSSGWSPTR